MDTDKKRRILAEARAAIERTAHINAAEWSPHAAAVERNTPAPEPKKQERGLDTAPIDWSSIIDQRIDNVKDLLVEVIGEALSQTFERQRDAYEAALHQRDSKIASLEIELAKLTVQISKLEVRVIEAEMRDRERGKVLDLPSPQLKVVVN